MTFSIYIHNYGPQSGFPYYNPTTPWWEHPISTTSERVGQLCGLGVVVVVGITNTYAISAYHHERC